jgi:hypothetical protein
MKNLHSSDKQTHESIGMNILYLIPQDEIIYLKEDIEELQFMHDCCGIDELITSRYKAKCKTAFPAATPECYENTVDGFRWMAYKNVSCLYYPITSFMILFTSIDLNRLSLRF